jgi:hypothetical protein
MFSPKSRYASLPGRDYTFSDGKTVRYISRRFLPESSSMPLLAEVTTLQGDRPDLISAKTLGDPEQFWRICDANNTIDPIELTAEPGRIVRVPVPQF